MWVVRSVQLGDLDRLYALVQSATRGLTSLQLNRQQLLDRIEHSTFAFSRSGLSPRGEPYVLVLENQDDGEIVGTSTIYAKTGGYQPLYAYELVPTEHYSELLAKSAKRVRLELRRIHDGPTEIGSLFLRGKYRGEGRGRHLSLARFALMAMLPHRFARRVIAEMRGIANPDGTVPFWEAVPGRFIPTDFATADALSTVSKQFIEEMMPQHPIYLDLLADEVRSGIGRVHRETEPALRLLKSEGFQQTEMVDIFDGGPMISCETDQILAVKRCRRYTVSSIETMSERSDRRMICSAVDGFRSAVSPVRINEPGGVIIDPMVASALRTDVGEEVWLLSLRP